ncbi:baseplate tail tube cap [Vibrio phage nt-1]|uniref:Baseplate tail tube cap n=1 Tax=Vibrio phage nt-1 TaxID=115992 RepID=R9TH00_9CAUD|nr:baseplate tail tube cap [Vibrio phage nt-1]AGN30383.1 baseplate tail tube cap [Vibrio phage nt-1]
MGLLDGLFSPISAKTREGLNRIETVGGVDSTTTEEVTSETDQGRVSQSGSVAHTYPSNLGARSGHPNFFIFRAYDMASITKQHYTTMRQSFSSRTQDDEQGAAISGTLMATLALYAPNLVEEVSHEFDKTTTSVLKDFLADAADIRGADSAGEAYDAGKRAATTAAGAAIAQIQRSFIQSNAAAALERGGQVVTDNVSVTAYKGTAQRTQTMMYQFHPKSLEELKEVAGVIKTFYRLSLPVKGKFDSELIKAGTEVFGSGFAAGASKFATVLKAPPVWMIEEVSDTDADRYTPRFVFGPAGITSVKLNRTPDQYWRTFRGTAGDPAGIELEVTFTELISLDRALYDNDIASSSRGYDKGYETQNGTNTNSGSFFGDITGTISGLF